MCTERMRTYQARRGLWVPSPQGLCGKRAGSGQSQARCKECISPHSSDPGWFRCPLENSTAFHITHTPAPVSQQQVTCRTQTMSVLWKQLRCLGNKDGEGAWARSASVWFLNTSVKLRGSNGQRSRVGGGPQLGRAGDWGCSTGFYTPAKSASCG